MKKFVIITDCKYGPNLESHILVAERDWKYIDFAVKFRPWDGVVRKDTLLYDSPDEAEPIIRAYMGYYDHNTKTYDYSDFWVEEVECSEETLNENVGTDVDELSLLL